MNCAMVHPALMFESSLPHTMLIYSEDDGRRFLCKINSTQQDIIAQKTVNIHVLS